MIAETVGQYRITSELGRGRFGITYRGEHIANKSSAVIKQLDPELTQDDQFHRRFAYETENIVRFYHAHLANILALISRNQDYYYITEDIPGSNLTEYLNRKEKLSAVQTSEIILEVCSALEYLHQRQYYHQHLHPGNIIIDKTGNVKLTDFALAALIGDIGVAKALHKPGVRYSQYIAPEQKLGKPADELTDIYPIGVLLYELISGEQYEPRKPVAAIPAAMQKIIAKCTTEDPAERYSAVTDIAADISQFLLTGTARAAVDPELAAISLLAPMTKRIHPVWWLIWAVGLAILIALPLYYLLRLRGFGESTSTLFRGVPFQRQNLPYSAAPETTVGIETTELNVKPKKTSLIKEETMFEEAKETPLTPEIIIPLTKGTTYEAVTSAQSGGLTGVGTNTAASPGESLNISSEETSPMTETIQPEPSVQVVVPAGNFIFGSNTGNVNEIPQRQVFVDTFLIDAYEVNNDQYAAFIQATGYPAPSGWTNRFYPLGQAKYPVTNVTWADASSYAAWVGCRLPTEVEWEKAARGTDGRIYPWGNQLIAANYCGPKIGHTSPVGSFPAGRSPYGAYDMAGNVMEWVADVYQPYAGNTAMPFLNSDPNLKVVRGGAFDTFSDAVRCSARSPMNGTRVQTDMGFRTVRSLLGTPAVAYHPTIPILLKLSCTK
jgi:formylglycine-generating enzyme required for sulfatase activity